MTQNIRNLFIANRGEICARIARTAKSMGIKTTAICAKEGAPLFLRDLVDQFIEVESETTALYLDGAKMIALATSAGCDAVHPGFGFLSENSQFANDVVSAGLTWVGPSSKAIASLANKSDARELAEKAGVPCTPGLKGFCPSSEDDLSSFAPLEEFAQKTGFPLLLKAAMGGGGKGMRLVRSKDELIPSAKRAYSEGLSSFGDGTLICEKYVERSRHVEVQIMADTHGQVFAVGDRDCSVQRRHQKILEESPAPFLGNITRKELHEAAIKLAKEVGYVNAGTVEFLVEWTDDVKELDKQPFYFLEMNTRLQVEHPVTEEVHGLDLVKCQLDVASGKALDLSLLSKPPQGHSIEARLYAENVDENFMPSPGEVKGFLPKQGSGIRWEIGLDPLDEVTPNFDPMIAKAISLAPSREEACLKLASALDETFLVGPKTNRNYLSYLLRESSFCSGAVDTGFIGREHENVVLKMNEDREKVSDGAEKILASVSRLGTRNRSLAEPSSQDIVTAAFSVSETNPTDDVRLVSEHQMFSSRYPLWKLSSQTAETSARRLFPVLTFLSAHEKITATLASGFLFERVRRNNSLTQGALSGGDDNIVSHVPGKVLAIKTSPGDTAQKGDTLFIVESMKMEFEIKAGQDGKISKIDVAVGQQVQSGKVLAHFELDS